MKQGSGKKGGFLGALGAIGGILLKLLIKMAGKAVSFRDLLIMSGLALGAYVIAKLLKQPKSDDIGDRG